MRALHEASGWFVVVANGVVGAWALAAHWSPRLRLAALWWCTVVAEVAIFVVAGSGVVIGDGDGPDSLRFHQFYGFVAMATVGIVYSYIRSYRQQLAAHRYLIYGLGGLFLMGLAIRALTIPAS
jgi:hypothetical protein